MAKDGQLLVLFLVHNTYIREKAVCLDVWNELAFDFKYGYTLFR